MELKFISQIRRGNKKGTGFLPIPEDKLIPFILSDKVQIKFLNNRVHFFAQIIEYSHKLGVYVPKSLMEKYGLLNKEVKIQMKKIKGFYAPVASDGRIYLPYDVVKRESLRHNDIVSVKIIEDNKVIQQKYVKVYLYVRPERKQKEFLCYLDPIFHGKNLIFQIEKPPIILQNKKNNPLMTQLFRGMHHAFINKNSMIIFKGNKVPAIINTEIKLADIAFYLGAYFADGTKIGNSWAICASTFEQARYYLKMHNSLIKDSRPEFVISYTNINKINDEKLKKNLVRIWKEETGIQINKFRIRKPTGKLTNRWNQHGTLVIREARQILLDIYNVLLKLLLKEILLKKDKNLAIDFLCGVMEGDGGASARNRGHILISTNKSDIPILIELLKITEVKFKAIREGENKYILRVGALEILRNFHQLKDKFFILYPKRRKVFFERFKTVGAVKFLIENHKSTNWVKALLRDFGFCNINYQLTSKGLNLRDELVANINKAIA